jgi:hypothetical protein
MRNRAVARQSGALHDCSPGVHHIAFGEAIAIEQAVVLLVDWSRGAFRAQGLVRRARRDVAASHNVVS